MFCGSRGCTPNQPILYHTRSGELTAVKRGNEIELNFPAIPQKQIKYPPELIAAIGGVKPKYVGMTKWNYIIELENEDAVRNLKPDYNVMLGLPGWGTIITALADEGNPGGFDFVSRFFAPEKGIQEDPVTGSAHCALVVFGRPTRRTDLKHTRHLPRRRAGRACRRRAYIPYW